ncbi:hypothetical protein JCM6882_002387 [Rhodosporidiobolus microsporus]
MEGPPNSFGTSRVSSGGSAAIGGASAFEMRWNGMEEASWGGGGTAPTFPPTAPMARPTFPPNRAFFRYDLTLPFPRVANAILGEGGSTQQRIQSLAGLKQLTVYPPTFTPDASVQLVGTKASIQEALRLIKNVLLVELYGVWTPLEWHQLHVSAKRTGIWDHLDESRCVPLGAEPPQPAVDSFGRAPRPAVQVDAHPERGRSSSPTRRRSPSPSLARSPPPAGPRSQQPFLPPPGHPSYGTHLLQRVGPVFEEGVDADEPERPPLPNEEPPPSPHDSSSARRRSLSPSPFRSRTPSPRRRSLSPRRRSPFPRRRSPSPSRSRSPPPRGREHPPRSPAERLVRYTVSLPFSNVASRIIGRGGRTHRRIRSEADLSVFSCHDLHSDSDGSGAVSEPFVELVGPRGGVRHALQLIEEVVYDRDDALFWRDEEWDQLRDRRWLDFDAWRCEDVDETRREKLEARDTRWRRSSRSPGRRPHSETRGRDAEYVFSTTMPFKKLAEYVEGPRGSTAARIRRRSELASVDISFASNGAAVLHLVGARRAILDGLDEVDQLVYGELRDRWREWEWEKLRKRGERDSGVAMGADSPPAPRRGDEEMKPSCEVDIPDFAASHFLSTAPTAAFISSATGCSLFLSSSNKGTVVSIEGARVEDVEDAKRDVERIVARLARDAEGGTGVDERAMPPVAGLDNAPSHAPLRPHSPSYPSSSRHSPPYLSPRRSRETDAERERPTPRSRSGSAEGRRKRSMSLDSLEAAPPSRTGRRWEEGEGDKRGMGKERDREGGGGGEAEQDEQLAVTNYTAELPPLLSPSDSSSTGHLVALDVSFPLAPLAPRAMRARDFPSSALAEPSAVEEGGEGAKDGGGSTRWKAAFDGGGGVQNGVVRRTYGSRLS